MLGYLNTLLLSTLIATTLVQAGTVLIWTSATASYLLLGILSDSVQHFIHQAVTGGLEVQIRPCLSPFKDLQWLPILFQYRPPFCQYLRGPLGPGLASPSTLSCLTALPLLSVFRGFHLLSVPHAGCALLCLWAFCSFFLEQHQHRRSAVPRETFSDPPRPKLPQHPVAPLFTALQPLIPSPISDTLHRLQDPKGQQPCVLWSLLYPQHNIWHSTDAKNY